VAASPGSSSPSKHAPAEAAPAPNKPAADALPAAHGDGDRGHATPVARPSTPAGGEFAPLEPEADSKGIYADKDFQQALELYKAGKLDAMAAPLRRCLAKNPGHPGAYYLGGLMRYDKGEFAKASFNFKRATAYPDRGPNAQFYLGRIYQKQERFAEAGKAYREYLKAAQSPNGRKQAESFLAQVEGNAPATAPEQGKDAPSAKEPEAIPVAKPGKPADPAAGDKHGHAPELTEAGKKPGHGSEDARHDDKGHGKPSAKEGEGGQPPAAKATPIPVAEAKALVLGRDGDFFFLIPDEESPSGKKMREAHLLCKADRFEKAANALKEAMLGYGGSPNADAAGLDLASVYLRLGLWEAARDRILDQVGNAPRDSVRYFDAAQYLLALSYLGLRDGAKAEKALLKVKPDAPDGPSREEVEYRLTQAGALMQDSKKQAGYLEKALAGAKTPARKAGYAKQLGALHAKYGGIDKAMDWYRKASADCKDPAMAEDCAESQLRLADLAYRKKDWKGAMDLYRKFVAGYPEHTESPWVHYQMANIYKVTNNFESALNEYKRVIDNYPDSYWASQAKWKREDTIWQKEYEEVLD
jgi:tetratricopeptide (TPR) repeat protein